MNKIFSNARRFFALLFVPVLAAACVNQDVDLPNASLRADKTQIAAPAMESDFTVALKANCNWQVVIEDEDAQWLSISPKTGLGNADIVLSLMPNTSTVRETEVTIRSTDDPSQTLTVFVKQSAHGSYLTIAELRSLASNLTVGTPEYTITEDKKICAIVNTAAIGANLPGGVFGIRCRKQPADRGKEPVFPHPAEEQGKCTVPAGNRQAVPRGRVQYPCQVQRAGGTDLQGTESAAKGNGQSSGYGSGRMIEACLTGWRK